jgi:hypothetical protein
MVELGHTHSARQGRLHGVRRYLDRVGSVWLVVRQVSRFRDAARRSDPRDRTSRRGCRRYRVLNRYGSTRTRRRRRTRTCEVTHRRSRAGIRCATLISARVGRPERSPRTRRCPRSTDFLARQTSAVPGRFSATAYSQVRGQSCSDEIVGGRRHAGGAVLVVDRGDSRANGCGDASTRHARCGRARQ